MAVQLPQTFDPTGETDKLLARAKTKASRNFRWTSAACFSSVAELGFLLHVLGRDEEALEVCRFVTQCEFAGNHSLWSPLEGLLALRSRLTRLTGETEEAAECVQRIRAAGLVESRLQGSLLSPERAERAAEEGQKALERDYRLSHLRELGILIELGGSEKCPVASLEKEYQENLARLRVLLGVKAA